MFFWLRDRLNLDRVLGAVFSGQGSETMVYAWPDSPDATYLLAVNHEGVLIYLVVSGY